MKPLLRHGELLLFLAACALLTGCGDAQGISFIDSSHGARVPRGSNLPVVNFSPVDKRINWVHGISRVDTGVIAVRNFQ